MIISLVEDAQGEWAIKLQPNLPNDAKKINSDHYDAARVGLVLLNVADILLRTFVGEVRRMRSKSPPGAPSKIVLPPAGFDLDHL